MPKQLIATKLEARLADLIAQRDRLQHDAWNAQRTTDARELGPVITAYGTILTWLDAQIDQLIILKRK